MFAARLARLLRAARRQRGRSLRALARASRGAFSLEELRALEAGDLDLTGRDIASLAELYDVDLVATLVERFPLRVDLSAGTIGTAGFERTFAPGDTEALLMEYLYLVRALRDLSEEPVVPLRREDVEVLATELGREGEAVVERLAGLMGLTVGERRSLVAAFVASEVTLEGGDHGW